MSYILNDLFLVYHIFICLYDLSFLLYEAMYERLDERKGLLATRLFGVDVVHRHHRLLHQLPLVRLQLILLFQALFLLRNALFNASRPFRGAARRFHFE